MISKILKAIWEFLFVQHGFLPFKRFTGSVTQMRQVAVAQKIIKGKPKPYECKICGRKFWALRKNDTCQNIFCFFKFRLRRENEN